MSLNGDVSILEAADDASLWSVLAEEISPSWKPKAMSMAAAGRLVIRSVKKSGILIMDFTRLKLAFFSEEDELRVINGNFIRDTIVNGVWGAITGADRYRVECTPIVESGPRANWTVTTSTGQDLIGAIVANDYHDATSLQHLALLEATRAAFTFRLPSMSFSELLNALEAIPSVAGTGRGLFVIVSKRTSRIYALYHNALVPQVDWCAKAYQPQAVAAGHVVTLSLKSGPTLLRP